MQKGLVFWLMFQFLHFSYTLHQYFLNDDADSEVVL